MCIGIICLEHFWLSPHFSCFSKACILGKSVSEDYKQPISLQRIHFHPFPIFMIVIEVVPLTAYADLETILTRGLISELFLAD